MGSEGERAQGRAESARAELARSEDGGRWHRGGLERVRVRHLMKTNMLASISVFLRPSRASGTTTPYEPKRPPMEKHELMKAHCATLIGLPVAASVAGTI